MASSEQPRRRRWIFPLFNGVTGLVFGGLIGYYVFRPACGFALGFAAGVLLGVVIEFLAGRLAADHWLYRRRVLLTILAECLFAVFFAGPYAYAYVDSLPNHHPVCCDTPLDLGAAQYEALQVDTAPGVTLAGWYVPPAREGGPVIILLHGGGGDRLGTAWHARQLIAAGYGVVMYDQRALGESTGEKTTYGWEDGSDLVQLVDWLASERGVVRSRIGAVGLSLGAQIAVNAAALDPAWSPPLWLDGMGAQTVEDFPTPGNAGERFALLINRLILKMFELRAGRAAPPAMVSILAGMREQPIMLVYGAQEPIEPRMAETYQAVAGPNASFWLVEHAWHVGGPSVAPDAYRRRMLEFFAAALALP